uniref:Uncharacterized protein n=1 Tax=Cucumis melo TaxID=3656 RepID=A0A9I9DVY7_CUCME
MDFVSKTPNDPHQPASLLSKNLTDTPKINFANKLRQCSKDFDKEDLQDFKNKLVHWLKEINNLKLSPTTLMDQPNTSFPNMQNEAIDSRTTPEKERKGSDCVK